MQHGGVTQDSMQHLSERIYRTGRLGSAALKMATSVQANSSACVSAFHRSLKRRPGGNFSPDKMMRFELLKNALHISHTTRLQISPTPSQPQVDEPTPRQPSLRSAWPSAFLGSAPPPSSLFVFVTVANQHGWHSVATQSAHSIWHPALCSLSVSK